MDKQQGIKRKSYKRIVKDLSNVMDVGDFAEGLALHLCVSLYIYAHAYVYVILGTSFR